MKVFSVSFCLKNIDFIQLLHILTSLDAMLIRTIIRT